MRTASDILPRPENRVPTDALSRTEGRVRTASDALPRPDKSVHTASEGLPRPDKSVHTASDPGSENSTSGGPAGQPPPEGKVHGGGEGHSMEPQPARDEAHKYTKVDKSKKNKEDDVPVFEALYQSSSSEEDKTKHGPSATS